MYQECTSLVSALVAADRDNDAKTASVKLGAEQADE